MDSSDVMLNLLMCLRLPVQNHTPECIVIDEISNRREVDSVRTIAARGVSMVSV